MNSSLPLLDQNRSPKLARRLKHSLFNIHNPPGGSVRPSLDMSRIGGWGETVTPNRAQLREAAQKKAAAAAAYVEQTRARVVVDMEKIEKRVLDSALSGDASNAVRNLRSAAGRIVLTRNNFEEVPRKMTGAVRRGLARAIRKGVANPLATV